jgi:hypothetical protein
MFKVLISFHVLICATCVGHTGTDAPAVCKYIKIKYQKYSHTIQDSIGGLPRQQGGAVPYELATHLKDNKPNKLYTHVPFFSCEFRDVQSMYTHYTVHTSVFRVESYFVPAVGWASTISTTA